MIEEKSSAVSLINELLSAKNELIYAKKIMDKKDKHIYPILNAPFKIPNTWQWVFLSDISIIQEGPGIRKHQYQDNGIQFLTVTNILEGYVDLYKSQKYISIDEYNEKYKHYTINKGDIVTACSGATWGKSAIYENENLLMLNTSTLRLRFFNDLGNNKFLYYLTKSKYFKSNLASHSTGQQPNYGYSHYSKIPIPIPPIEEQKRIVQLLNEVLHKIDQAKTNIEKNIENAKELFQSKLNDIFSQKGDGWQKKKLIEVNKFIDYRGKTPKKTESGIKLITAKNVRMGYMRNEPEEFIAEEDYDDWMTRGIPKEGDVLFTTEAPLANVTLLNTSEKIALAQRIITLCPNREILSGEFLTFCLQSKIIQDKILEKGTGATVTGIKSKLLKEIIIPIPPIDSQEEIVGTMNQIRNYTDDVINTLQKKSDSLDELKKSILQKAFAGELTKNEVAV